MPQPMPTMSNAISNRQAAAASNGGQRDKGRSISNYVRGACGHSADEEGEVCKLYGVWQSETRDGVMKRGVRRSTFIISSDGVLRHVLHDVTPRGHAAEVFQLVKQLNSRKLNGNRQKHGRHA